MNSTSPSTSAISSLLPGEDVASVRAQRRIHLVLIRVFAAAGVVIFTLVHCSLKSDIVLSGNLDPPPLFLTERLC